MLLAMVMMMMTMTTYKSNCKCCHSVTHMPKLIAAPICRLSAFGKTDETASRVSFISSQLLFIFSIILLNIETMNNFFCFSSSCSSPIKMVWLSWQGSQAASLYSARPNLSTVSFHQIFVLNPEKWILLSVRGVYFIVRSCRAPH